MKNNKIIILLIGLLLIIFLVTFIYIKNNKDEKSPGEKTITTNPTTNVVSNEETLTDEEVIKSLNIYSGQNYEFVITDENTSNKIVERKNKETGEVDMKFKVDTNTGIHEIENIKGQSHSTGGGAE